MIYNKLTNNWNFLFRIFYLSLAKYFQYFQRYKPRFIATISKKIKQVHSSKKLGLYYHYFWILLTGNRWIAPASFPLIRKVWSSAVKQVLGENIVYLILRNCLDFILFQHRPVAKILGEFIWWLTLRHGYKQLYIICWFIGVERNFQIKGVEIKWDKDI